MTLTREQIADFRDWGRFTGEQIAALCDLALLGLDAQSENERLREWQNEIERRDDIIKSESALRLDHEKEELRLLRRIEGLIVENERLSKAFIDLENEARWAYGITELQNAKRALLLEAAPMANATTQELKP